MESYLIQDEPERGGRFSYKMSLKERVRMLGIDHQHGTCSKIKPGTNPGISGSQRRGALPGPGPAGVVRVGEPDAQSAGLRATAARRKRIGTVLRRQDDRIEPGPSRAADWMLPTKRPSDTASLPPESFSATLHARRYRTAGCS